MSQSEPGPHADAQTHPHARPGPVPRPRPPVRPTRRRLLLGTGAAVAGAVWSNGTARAADGTRTGTAHATGTATGTGTVPAAPTGIGAYASYWFPDSLPAGTPGPGIVWRSLKDWSPAADPDLAHNTATVPLAPRFTPVPANITARAGQARIAALVSFGGTSGHPAQGSPTADTYALSHWAYIDELVFWGGSAGEGIVLAPTAPVTDAAHRNGVRVLGNVFLPPVVYGGDLRWTRDLVQRDATGRFPLAEQLVRVATAYGFDGWFVNAETDGGDSELAAAMRAFLKALRAAGRAGGLRITWYDAMDTTGRIRWQGALNHLNQEFYEDRDGPVADGFFVDFRWTPDTLRDSGLLADRLGRSRYELWAGVDVESRGWDTDARWDAIVPPGRDHVVSYAFYRPEWTRNHLADRSPGAFHAADDRFWTGASLDPAHPANPVSPTSTTSPMNPMDPARRADTAWRPPAAVVADRSTVAALPFGCAFNTGHGLRWYEHGRVTSAAPWSHLGLQDLLPGRRWALTTTGARPAVTLDFADAWRGGSSLLVQGALTAPVTVGLHATRLPLSAATVLELVHRTGSGPVRVEAGIATREPAAQGAPVPYTWLPAGTAGRTAAPGWQVSRVPLAPLAGRTAYALAVRLTALGRDRGPVLWRLGALAVHDRDGRGRPRPPAAPAVDAAERDGAALALRLSWRRSDGPVRHYELHHALPDGSRRFLGGTCGTALHVPRIERAGRERTAVVEVRAVGELYDVSAPARITHPW
ncbi:endo-beta-N-acetylglucosaminidase [Streptomyces sp. NPDC090022]|uniref:endo-beta-N-acetylglucosaminidase n=1 Tax=Streptomyces sp. NPDC090022 TaxID=3365920 RepID=UPI0038255DD1